jgi:hypothetical protein
MKQPHAAALVPLYDQPTGLSLGFPQTFGGNRSDRQKHFRCRPKGTSRHLAQTSAPTVTGGAFGKRGSETVISAGT